MSDNERAKGRRGFTMRKLIYFILFVIVGYMIFNIFNGEKDTKVIYKTITQNGATFDVPEDYVESYNAYFGRYSYGNNTDTFSIAVQKKEAENLTINQYLSYVKQLLTKGSVKIGRHTIINKDSSMSNCSVSGDKVEAINGINMGKLVVVYDSKVKDETYHITENIYFTIVDNQIIEFSLSTKTGEEEKYQAMIDHVVKSIKIQ